MKRGALGWRLCRWPSRRLSPGLAFAGQANSMHASMDGCDGNGIGGCYLLVNMVGVMVVEYSRFHWLSSGQSNSMHASMPECDGSGMGMVTGRWTGLVWIGLVVGWGWVPVCGYGWCDGGGILQIPLVVLETCLTRNSFWNLCFQTPESWNSTPMTNSCLHWRKRFGLILEHRQIALWKLKDCGPYGVVVETCLQWNWIANPCTWHETCGSPNIVVVTIAFGAHVYYSWNGHTRCGTYATCGTSKTVVVSKQCFWPHMYLMLVKREAANTRRMLRSRVSPLNSRKAYHLNIIQHTNMLPLSKMCREQDTQSVHTTCLCTTKDKREATPTFCILKKKPRAVRLQHIDEVGVGLLSRAAAAKRSLIHSWYERTQNQLVINVVTHTHFTTWPHRQFV